MSDAELLEIARRWLRYAEEDLAAAKRVLLDKHPARHACWAAQQAAEKVFKAVLVRKQLVFPRTHSLEALNNLLPDECKLVDHNDELASLSAWAVESRYPGPWPEASDAESQRAVQTALLVFDSLSKEVR